MRYQPLHDRLIVEEIEENKRTGGGIWIPDAYTSQKHVAFGRVLEAGIGRANIEGRIVPLTVKKDDIIAFPRQAPGLIPIFDENGDEKIVLMLREAEVIAIVHDLPRATTLVDRTGAPLSLQPTSLALPDAVYSNREGIDRAVSDLKNAPPDVIADVKETNDDEHTEID